MRSRIEDIRVIQNVMQAQRRALEMVNDVALTGQSQVVHRRRVEALVDVAQQPPDPFQIPVKLVSARFIPMVYSLPGIFTRYCIVQSSTLPVDEVGVKCVGPVESMEIGGVAIRICGVGGDSGGKRTGRWAFGSGDLREIVIRDDGVACFDGILRTFVLFRNLSVFQLVLVVRLANRTGLQFPLLVLLVRFTSSTLDKFLMLLRKEVGTWIPALGLPILVLADALRLRLLCPGLARDLGRFCPPAASGLPSPVF